MPRGIGGVDFGIQHSERLLPWAGSGKQAQLAALAQQRQLPAVAQAKTRHLLSFIDELETLGIVFEILQRLLGQAVLTLPALCPLPYLIREGKEARVLALVHQLPLQRGQFFVMAGLAAQGCTQSPTAHREAETAKAHRG